jgi:hypothetical protein
MSKIKQDKIPMVLTEKNILEIPSYKYKLLRERDNLLNFGDQVGWIEWGENGRYKQLHEEPAVGRSLILDPRSAPFYTWMTTTVTEIIQQSENYLKFKTGNSTYELWQEQQENKKENMQ